MHPAIDSLFLALEAPFSHILDDDAKQVCFLRAELHPSMAEVLADHTVICEQPFKPDFNLLERAGLDAVPAIENAPKADVVLYLATRNREENSYNLARAMGMLKPGGKLVAAQHNKLGAGQLEKDLKALAGSVEVFSKKHSRVLLVEKHDNINSEVLNDYLTSGKPHKVQQTPLYTKPGLFSWKQVDLGSQMLADVIEQEDLHGVGADFGAGWGFLAHRALKLSPRITELHLYEADKNALDMCMHNLSSIKTKLVPHWADLVQDPIEGQFDFIITNPPQHTITTQSTALPLQMTDIAAKHLKPGGVMWLVTNRQVPVERILEKHFRKVVDLAEDKHYKIFRVVK